MSPTTSPPEQRRIPHGPPTRFELDPDGAVTLPATHPLAEGGSYPSAALVELAAQLVGRLIVASKDDHLPRGGVLVEVRELELWVDRVPAGTRLVPEIVVERASPPLPRFQVRLPGVLRVGLSLMVR